MKAYLGLKCVKERHTVVQVHLSIGNEEHSMAWGSSHFIHQATTCKEGRPNFIPILLSSAQLSRESPSAIQYLVEIPCFQNVPSDFWKANGWLISSYREARYLLSKVSGDWLWWLFVQFLNVSVYYRMHLWCNQFIKEKTNPCLLILVSEKMYYYASKQENP